MILTVPANFKIFRKISVNSCNDYKHNRISNVDITCHPILLHVRVVILSDEPIKLLILWLLLLTEHT